MIYFFITLHVLISIFLVLVVLLQQGKGADLSVFGGGATMTAFGARGAATLLHKLTVIGFILFIFTTVTIGVLESSKSKSSVMGDLPATEEAQPVGEAEATNPDAATTTPPAETEAEEPASAEAGSEPTEPEGEDPADSEN